MDRIWRITVRKVLPAVCLVPLLLFCLSTPLLAAAKKRHPTQAMHLNAASNRPEPSPFTEATFLFPKGVRVEPRWVLPPTEKNRIDAIFGVNAGGSPVLAFSGDSNYYLLHPDKMYMVAVNAELSGMTHLSSGALLLAAGNDLLLPAEPNGKTFDKKGVPYAALQPLTKVPLRKIDLLASAGTTVYCGGVDARSGRHSLYLLRSIKGGGILDMELAYESNEPITAVTGDADTLYLAKGRTVVRYSLKDGAETVYYTHPTSMVSGLAMSPAGLVVSTGREIVLAGRTGAMEIMRSSEHRIAMAGDTLYIFFNTSLGVLAIDNLEDLRRFNLSVRPVAAGEKAPPLAISNVRFFESDSVTNYQGFAESFDRKQVRLIVAQIELDKSSLAKVHRDHSITVSWYEPGGGRLASASYLVAKGSGNRIFAAVGKETEHGYAPPHWIKNGHASYSFTNELAARYPGRYRMQAQVDGIPAGEWSFTLTGQATPAEAISYDDMATLKNLLDNGVSARSTSDNGEPLLSEAVQFGSVRAVQMLLERGADPNATNREGAPPLAKAEYAADWRAKAELLLRHGANINAPRFKNGTPLVSGISTEYIAFLLKNGANYSYDTSYGRQNLLTDILNVTCTEDILSLLVQRGADLNEISTPLYFHYTPLGNAIFHANERCTQLLLEKGASTDIVQREPNLPPRSALYVALSTLNSPYRSDPKDKAALRRIVRLLLRKGAALRPGKKLATSALFDIPEDDYKRKMEETISINAGEGWVMFAGEGPSFFEPVDMVRTLEQDDAALNSATDSKDPAIRELALGAHLNRVRELTAMARDQYDMMFKVHDHCEKAFKISETSYSPAQVDVVPELPPSSTPGEVKPLVGLKLLKRVTGGAYVQGVAPGSPADRAGLKVGDIIVALDTQKMKDADEVAAATARLTPGMPVRVTFLRDEPMRVPDLQLACGLVETEYKPLWGYAEMNLSRWLAARPDNTVSDQVRTKIRELAAGGPK